MPRTSDPAASPCRAHAILASLCLCMAALLALTACAAPPAPKRPAKAKPAPDSGAARAQKLYESGRYPEAVALLRDLVEKSPKDVELKRRLALAEAAAGKPDAAAAQLESVVRVEPRDHESLFRLAMFERASGETTSAEGHLKAALEIAPGTTSYVEELAKTQLLLNKPDEALKLWTRLLRERSLSAERRKSFLVQKGECYLAAGRRAKAVRAWEQALSLDPGDVQLQRRLAAER